ncbi:MAG TPA: HU family DNA-binding protein [Archangium sp.]
MERERDEVLAALRRDGHADWPGLGRFERRDAEVIFTPAPGAVAELLRLLRPRPPVGPDASALVDGRARLDVPGFGAFVLNRQARYEGRHPVTKAPIVVEASEEISFEPA